MIKYSFICKMCHHRYNNFVRRNAGMKEYCEECLQRRKDAVKKVKYESKNKNSKKIKE